MRIATKFNIDDEVWYIFLSPLGEDEAKFFVGNFKISEIEIKAYKNGSTNKCIIRYNKHIEENLYATNKEAWDECLKANRKRTK